MTETRTITLSGNCGPCWHLRSLHGAAAVAADLRAGIREEGFEADRLGFGDVPAEAGRHVIDRRERGQRGHNDPLSPGSYTDIAGRGHQAENLDRPQRSPGHD